MGNHATEVVLHPDTLLAYEMSGTPLSPKHGFPNFNKFGVTPCSPTGSSGRT
ncbi:molybdopterin-dependent oxidoreductase [Alicyclobacillus fastidiosus]|uniref:molybdopterin-dependent oxidoreductase n=1 Tax=Alicyclobacillus fastidiosus TaxID=392011 RepID=UPI0034DCEE18